MWRSYGMGSVGVGLVINPMPLYSTTDALKAYSNPVSYQSPNEFFESMRKVATNIVADHDFLKSQGEKEVFNGFFNLLLNTALCSKRPGFEEEQEWRIMHIPQMWPSDVLIRATETIGGVPQTIYKIPLKDIPEQGLAGIEIPSILERVIIGPTDYPLVVYRAFVDALAGAGVSNPGEKVVASRIPLRNGR